MKRTNLCYRVKWYFSFFSPKPKMLTQNILFVHEPRLQHPLLTLWLKSCHEEWLVLMYVGVCAKPQLLPIRFGVGKLQNEWLHNRGDPFSSGQTRHWLTHTAPQGTCLDLVDLTSPGPRRDPSWRDP